METVNRQSKLHFLLYLFAIIGIALTVYNGISNIFTKKGLPVVSAQTDPFLDRRINQLEQRFFSIESRITRLEQESRLRVVSPPPSVGITNNNESEIRLLRSQIESFRFRLGEIECGLLKVDERSLPETARRLRRQAAAGVMDPCRKSPSEPVKLSARP